MTLKQYTACNVCGNKPPPGRKRCPECEGWQRCIACHDFFLNLSNALCPDCRRMVCHPPTERHTSEAPQEQIARLTALAEAGLPLFPRRP